MERVTSVDDLCWGRVLSVYCNSIKYPSPDAYASTSPARGEVLTNILSKGLDAVRQYEVLFERRVQSSTRVRKAQAMTRQTKHIRNLLLQCASDATGFLSDVYKKSTRARKFLADGVQCGRSMIEMLGVLAIIAVLSVGGIAGYSKAMERFKVNKLIQEYNDLIFGLLEYRQSFQKNIKYEQYLTDYIITLNLVPSTWTKLDAAYLQDSLGNWVNARYRQPDNIHTSFTKEGIIIDFNLGGLNIDEQGNKSSDNFNEKICFEMLNNIVQPLHQTIYGMLMVGGGSGYYYGDAYCNKSNCLSNLTLTQMKEFCDSCNKTQRCNVTIVF